MMKLNPNFLLHNIGEETLLVPTAGAPFHGLLQGNETIGFILKQLEEETTEEEIVSALADEYKGNIGDMREDVSKTLFELRRIGAIDE
ncbi:PqqD family protein [uncultured Ruminococcus sp.]|uniref:PqqD family protein n=1 Tax=uncultured Ruminococcus sp. TaxID=165186 RepID=UPI00292D3503|nr:PqqD family protein [uncultured Ruminococcus sp.]